MSPALTRQRCFHHSSREAVSRCPQCRRYYCRECVTEHQGRVLCAACIEAEDAAPSRPVQSMGRLLLPVGLLAGMLISWFCFYYLGALLTKLPAPIHESNRP